MAALLPSWQRTDLDMSRTWVLKAFSARIAPKPHRSIVCSAAAAAADALPRVVLKGGKTRLFTDAQSPTVYGGAVDRVLGRPAPKAGDVVAVTNGSEEIFGWGLYNPASMYRVRIMQTLDDAPADALAAPDLPALLSARVAAAAAARAAVGLPAPGATTVYRLVNSEGDRLSGLVVDVLGDVATVQSSAAWVERRRELIEGLVKEHAGVTDIVWRQAAELRAEEGWEEEEEEEEEEVEGAAAAAAEAGEGAQGGATVLEAGLSYAVDPWGQKTGFYCDQRDHRAFIRGLASGKDVLDLCCYSGGFALSAAAGGARSAHGVDSSAPAVELARRNAALNGFLDVSFEKAEAAEFMKRAAGEGRAWDVVVLDPPKLAPSRKALQSAWRKYESLNAAALRLVRPGGLLMTCSCSGAVAASGEFVPMVQKAARRARRRVRVLRLGGAAPDHPLDPGYPEGAYLTNLTVLVE